MSVIIVVFCQVSELTAYGLVHIETITFIAVAIKKLKHVARVERACLYNVLMKDVKLCIAVYYCDTNLL